LTVVIVNREGLDDGLEHEPALAERLLAEIAEGKADASINFRGSNGGSGAGR
jgi:hypothetical protein